MYNPFLIYNPKVKEQRSKPAVDQSNPEPEVGRRLLHTIRTKHKNWESLRSNSVHLCVIYPLLVCYRLARWCCTTFLSTLGGLHELTLPRFGLRISCMFEVMFKRSSLPHSVYFLFFCFLFKKTKRNETAQEGKERKNKSTKRTPKTARASCRHQNAKQGEMREKLGKRGLSELS